MQKGGYSALVDQYGLKTLPHYRTSEISGAALGRQLPGLPFEMWHRVEMLIAAQDGQSMLQCQGRDPSIVRWDGTASALQSYAQIGISDCSLIRYRQNFEVRKVRFQPRLIGRALLGLGYPVAKFTKHNDGYCRTRLSPQNIANANVSVHERGERVGIEDHARSSGSMISKARSILA